MPLDIIKRLCGELFRWLVVAALVLAGVGAGAARADPAWTQTSQADFEMGTLFQVDTSSSPGEVKLAIDPSSEQSDQSNPNHTYDWRNIGDNRWCAQTFVAGMTGKLTGVVLYLKKRGSPEPLTIELRDCAGASSPPGSSILASLTAGDVTSFSGQEYQFVFPSPASVTGGTHYAVVLQAASCNGGYYWVGNQSGDIYPDGKGWKSYSSGGDWYTEGYGYYDFYFRTYVAAGYYASGTLTSSAHDTGYAADFGSISWHAETPAGTDIKFQIATNNDNLTWDFKGPDGSSGTYYTSSDTVIWSGHDGDRYIRYRAFFSTADAAQTPSLQDISLAYTQPPPVVAPAVATGNATLVEETAATLHGTVADDGGEACQYRFQWGTTPGGPYTDNTSWAGGKTTGESFRADITGLAQGTKYYFRAQARNSVGTASGAELSWLTKPEPPVSSTFAAAAVGSSRIDLSWAKGVGAYRTMIRRQTGGFPADRDDGDLVYFDTGTSFSDTGLSPSTTYYYRAWSEVTGSQQWSDGYGDASATTEEGPPPPTAVGGTVYPVNKAQVLAPWLGLLLGLSAAGGVAFGRIRKRITSPTA